MLFFKVSCIVCNVSSELCGLKTGEQTLLYVYFVNMQYEQEMPVDHRAFWDSRFDLIEWLARRAMQCGYTLDETCVWVCVFVCVGIGLVQLDQ